MIELTPDDLRLLASEATVGFYNSAHTESERERVRDAISKARAQADKIDRNQAEKKIVQDAQNLATLLKETGIALDLVECLDDLVEEFER